MRKMEVIGKLLCILLLLLHKSSGQQGFNDKNELRLPKDYKIGWMGALNDNTLISDITIPGTHDTMALHGGPLAKCQSWSLMKQLEAGIRYLDLRVSGENLNIKHGIMYQFTTFPKVLNTIKTFLSKYRNETMFVRVKPVRFCEKKVPHLVEDIIKSKYPDSWIKPAPVPRIGEVRGKIVFVQKNCFNLGVSLNETDEKDDYKVTDVKEKTKKIVNHLNDATKMSRNGSVVLNYSSGTGIGTIMGLMKGLTPKKIAKEINPWLYKHLEKASNLNPKPCYGIIAMDFPSFDLIQKVIRFNY